MSQSAQIEPGRVESGVPGFDPLVEGGLPEGRIHVVSGPPGSGKTTFCTQFLTHGAVKGECGLFLSVHETERQLLEDMGGYDFRLQEAMTADRLRFMNVFSEAGRELVGRAERKSGGRMTVKHLTEEVSEVVESADIDRLVVDSTMLLGQLFPESDNAVEKFLTALKRVDATTLLISEMTDPSAYAPEHYLAHGVVFFHNYLDGGEMTRGIQLLKMRGTAIDCSVRSLEFDDRGVVVDATKQVSL